MGGRAKAKMPYARFLSASRRRVTAVTGRTLEEEADADRGRVLFSAPFRRLQNKAQVFSLETNAAVRSRLTHSLEVSSIGRYAAQQAVKAFGREELQDLGIAGHERALLTFVETACLLHDLGNPPFGHFGEIAISDWFHEREQDLRPDKIGGRPARVWQEHFHDLLHFDGNPQGFRIVTRLQAQETADLFGLNLTATTLAATLKYPWPAQSIGQPHGDVPRKKQGYFGTETDVVGWLREVFGLAEGVRHPLVFLMEAADDIAYCMSDIEDGIEKRIVDGHVFSDHLTTRLEEQAFFADVPDEADAEDLRDMRRALQLLRDPRLKRASSGADVQRLVATADLRSAVIRYLTRQAGTTFRALQPAILRGSAEALLHHGKGAMLLGALKEFAEEVLYSSAVVRQRELTAHAALSGLLTAYLPLMKCDRGRWEGSRQGRLKDDQGRRIARENSLAGRLAKKYCAVYDEAVRQSDQEFAADEGMKRVMERIHRIRLFVDYVSGMTDEFALESHHLVAGVHINPHRH